MPQSPRPVTEIESSVVSEDQHHHGSFEEVDLAQALLAPSIASLEENAAAAAPVIAATTFLTSHPLEYHDWTAMTTSWDPPVAPAVVVVEDRNDEGDDDHASRPIVTTTTTTGSSTNEHDHHHDNPESPSYSYPVATFVRDLVRTGMENVQNVRIAASAHAADVVANNHGSSPPNVRTVLSTRLMRHSQTTTNGDDDNDNGSNPEGGTASFSMEDDDQEAEYILVDGEMIAIQASTTPHYQRRRRLQQQHEEDDNLRNRQDLQLEDDFNNNSSSSNHLSRACRPTRFQRGVRKLNKILLFRRRKDDRERTGTASTLSASTMHTSSSNASGLVSQNRSLRATGQQQSSEQQQQVLQPSAPAATDEMSTAVGSAASLSSSLHNKKKSRRKMLSWRQQQQQDEARLHSHYDDSVGYNDRAPSSLSPSRDYAGLAAAPPIPPTIRMTDDGEAVGFNHNNSNGSSNNTSMASGRTESVTASFVGTADQLLEADVLGPATVSAEAYVEFDDPFSKKDETAGHVQSLVPRDADYKVDKAEAPDVESMLRRAAFETTNDIESSSDPIIPRLQRRPTGGKTSGSSIPLSLSCANDEESAVVHNDMLKVVMVGCLHEKTWLARTIRDCPKRPRKRATLGVDVHLWTPPNINCTDDISAVKCSIWDVQGATSTIDGSPNFGGHPATQSLFFSGQALYILVYDLAVGNTKSYLKRPAATEFNDDTDDDDDDDEEDYDDEFVREEANRHADRALQADIQSRVLSWIDCIARRGPQSAILPVAVISESMSREEVRRRSMLMQHLIEEHVRRFAADINAPKLLTGEEDVLCVRYSDGYGVDKLRETIYAIATDTSQAVFEHVGTPVPPGTALVYDVIRRLKQDYKMVQLDHLMVETGESIERRQVIKILQFLDSIGEILYNAVGDDVLSQYIILSRKWLVSALSCILRNDLNRELEEARRFMNMQCLYSDHKFQENELVKVLVSGPASSCPLLSDSDADMLWQSMSFMREAADRYSQMDEDTTTAPSIFYFLEKLLVHAGILVPLGMSQQHLDSSEVFFVPSLLAQVDPRDIWTFKSSESWMCVLSNSWLFRNGAPSHLMEHISVELLKDVFTFSQAFPPAVRPHAIQRAKTVPVRGPSLHDFYEKHDEQVIGRVRIHQIMCWQSSVLVKIGTVFADKETDQLRESFVEILVTVVDQSSNICVASDAMRSGMHRVIVSGKGQVGHHGKKLWEGGYKVVMDSINSTLENYSNVDSQIVCPECLAHSLPHSACTWSQDSVLAVAEGGSAIVRCMRGHRVDSNLICGRHKDFSQHIAPVDNVAGVRHTKPVSELLPSVVLVGLYDPQLKRIASVGSGFVVDRKMGLIVTAGHVLLSMEEGRHFGSRYFGIKNAKVVIGITNGDKKNAVFRYFADIVADDIQNVDAVVLRIQTRMENDVDDDGAGCDDQCERPLDPLSIQSENLKSLKMTARCELEEAVRILGFNQGGEGILEQGMHLNRSFDLARGYVCKIFKSTISDDSSTRSSDSSCNCNFSPREEIVIMCPTISGHSGGPCVNDEGKVIGILSRADPVDRQRCYLVPAHEIKCLVAKARKDLTRPPGSGLPLKTI